jgi:chromodomain-helicase-DNA-binding protein 4
LSLVACPKSVLSSWRAEFQKRCPLLTIHLWTGDLSGIEDSLQYAEKYIGNIFLTSLDKLPELEPALQRLPSLDVIVLDEILHPSRSQPSTLTLLSLIAKKYDSMALVLTATSLQKDPLWLLPLARLVFYRLDSEGLLDNLGTFPAEELSLHLKQNLENVTLRRLKSSVTHEAPPRFLRRNIVVPMTSIQTALYENVLSAYSIESLNTSDPSTVLNLLMALRKICNHPAVYNSSLLDSSEPGFWTSGSKMQVLDRILPALKAAGRRIIISTQMTKMLDIIEKYMAREKYNTVRIDGSTSQADRQRAVEALEAADSQIFAVLTTTRTMVRLAPNCVDTVIFYDPDFNAPIENSLVDLAFGPKPPKIPNLVLRLISDKSAELHLATLARSAPSDLTTAAFVRSVRPLLVQDVSAGPQPLISDEEIQRNVKSWLETIARSPQEATDFWAN